MKPDDIVIISAKRTPMGNLLGELSSLTAPELASFSHKSALEAAKISPSDINEVFSGCVLQAGIGQAPARQAAIFAGIPDSVGATTINKMCGSGMKAVMLAHDALAQKTIDIALAGGMESMSQAPYLLPKARKGYRLGHGELKDHLFLDGLEDAYEPGKLMGAFAEMTAEAAGFTRKAQDEFAMRSMERALHSIEKGLFKAEIAEVTIKDNKGNMSVVSKDEGPDVAKLSKIERLKPAFKTDGTVTAANSSSISDGAASLILMRYEEAVKRGLSPMARIVAKSSHAGPPSEFTTAPVGAIEKVLTAANWKSSDVDLYEINEAFAVVTMFAMKKLNLPHEIVNIRGGACALGHPIGASGARILVTLLHALKSEGKKRGVAALCIGGGEATAVAIELT